MSGLDNSNLTVLVKKKDGSFERVPISQLNKPVLQSSPVTNSVVAENLPMITKPSLPANIPKDKAIIEISKNEELKLDEIPLTRKDLSNLNTAKSAQIKVEKDRADNFGVNKNDFNKIKLPEKPITTVSDRFTGLSGNDFRSPLEEPVSLPVGGPLLPKNDSYQSVADKIISDLKIELNESAKERLSKALQLYFKGVRDEWQTKEFLSRPFRDAGIGLTEELSFEILNRAKKNMPSKSISNEDVDNSDTKINIPNSFEQQVNVNPPKTDLLSAVNKKQNDSILHREVVKKVKMKDISGGNKIYGPAEEIGNFTLTDLRRLSFDAGEAVRRLAQKFITIKEESVVLYLQAVAAWEKSPLYFDYVKALSESLSQGISLEKVLIANKDGINLQEVENLIKMEQSFEA